MLPRRWAVRKKLGKELMDNISFMHVVLYRVEGYSFQSPSNTATYIRLDNAKGSVTANPLNVEYMLKTNFHNFPKGDQLTSLGRDFLGEGIFNAHNDTWKIQRKIASHKFSPKSLQNFVMNHVKFEISTSNFGSTEIVPTCACELQNVPKGRYLNRWYICWQGMASYVPDLCNGKDGKHLGHELRYEFQPERWLQNGRFKKENPFRFPVFHAGPRMCLGKDMAYLQMKSIAASVIERFEIHVQDKCPKQLLSLTLKMEGGLHEKMKERSVDM
ncbi:Cytochrome P450, family 94, subfamily D, polypeptide 1, putative [Theobroma cacao]|uniref:Cytochrome P450, family 94, subfamily D, polypeptide 1, putative n=1 Tax=Theobroma cacao TaxID=3641 RepID=A0A061GUU7_THECC|nr:Cytochrome P450, family 94, subfamily D, polypeptide 1, putative [Theobroma cacao]